MGVQVPPRAPYVCGRGSAVEHRLAKARVAGSIPVVRSIFLNVFAPLAQLDRAFDYESKGQEFESLRAHHFYLVNTYSPVWRNWQTRTTQNREGNRGGSSPFTGIHRDVAQLGRAPGLGPGGRMFKSCRPDSSFMRV